MSDQQNRITCWENAGDSTGIEAPLWAIASALFANAGAIAYAARHLGTSDAATSMGALEYVGKEIHDAGKAIAEALAPSEFE